MVRTCTTYGEDRMQIKLILAYEHDDKHVNFFVASAFWLIKVKRAEEIRRVMNPITLQE
jgi:hypothetical protein